MYLNPEIYNLTSSVLKIDINYRKAGNISMQTTAELCEILLLRTISKKDSLSLRSNTRLFSSLNKGLMPQRLHENHTKQMSHSWERTKKHDQ